MGLTLLPLAVIGPSSVLTLTFICLLLHALAAATQDVAIDAWCISVLPPGERGTANGWMQAGMLLGRSLFGGGTLLLMSTFGPRGGVLLLIAVIWGIALLVTYVDTLPTPHPPPAHTTGVFGALRAAFGVLFRSRIVWYAFGFALLAGAVFEGLGSLAGPLLIDMGRSEADAGFFFSVPAIVAMIGGALVGGYASDRLGSRAAVTWTFLLLVGLVLLFSSGLILGWIRAGEVIGGLTAVYAGIGLFTASSYALFMDLSLSPYSATSFSAYMGVTNMCESWSAFAAGLLVPNVGYGIAFAVLALVSIASLAFLRGVSRVAAPPIPSH